jgi:diadenosine tetraphosphate (Ap4A) HIT family hydrolase
VIVPTRHVTAFYDLDVQEQGAIWAIVREIQQRLASTVEMSGVDIGFQDATSPDEHAHVHVVPRTAQGPVVLPREADWVFSSNADS